MIVSAISNSYHVAFSQYIPPPLSPSNSFSSSNNIQSLSIQQCPHIEFSDPSYTGPDGCPRPCPTSGDIPNECLTNNLSQTTTSPYQNQQYNLSDSSKGLPSSLGDYNLLRPNIQSNENVIKAPLSDRPIITKNSNRKVLTETTREIGNNCSDKLDNDHDGKIDSNDEDCNGRYGSMTGCIGVSYYSCYEVCDDRVDNNQNGFIDMQEIFKANHGGCFGINPPPYTSGCFGNGPSFKIPICAEICNDGVDNNINGKVDESPCSRDPLNLADSTIIPRPPPFIMR